MEIVVGIWLVINLVITLYQLVDAFENWDIEYPIWGSILLIVLNVWEDMEYDYNLAGRIIIAIILTILTLPAIIATAAIIFVLFIIFGLPWGIFYLIFKKR